MQCVVLAGGLATRMRPLTEKVPKVLLEVGGQPFLRRALTWWAEQGVTEVVLSVGHLSELIDAELARAPSPVPVKVVREPEPLGTAGALRYCLKSGALAEKFLLTWGDSFLPIDFRAVFDDYAGSNASAAMTVLENRGRWDKSNVMIDQGKLALYDKAGVGDGFTHIDYGLMALSSVLVDWHVPEKGDLAGFFNELSRVGELRGFEVRRRFYEIGSPAGLADLEKFVKARTLVVLDRDGVLNKMIPREGEPRPDSPMGPEEVELLPGVPEAVASLTQLGATVVIASNQPAAAKGKTTREKLEAAHAKVVQLCEAKGGMIASSHLCFHRAEDECSCRKPKPGLLLEALAAYPDHAAENAFMVGDREIDAQAGRAAGMSTVLVAGAEGAADFRRADLTEFVKLLRALKGL
ncbi:MAG: HAD-IIIA family hydrolase [Myxococcaceae bacterium]